MIFLVGLIRPVRGVEWLGRLNAEGISDNFCSFIGYAVQLFSRGSKSEFLRKPKSLTSRGQNLT